MTIAASSGWFMKLDADGQPIGPKTPFGEGVATFSVEESECAYGDTTCPCQNGDVCHYEGPNPMTSWHTLTLEFTALNLLFGSRRVFGWSRPLAINGREYRRRVRRR